MYCYHHYRSDSGPLHYIILDNGQNAAMVLKKLSKYPLDVDVRDKKTGKTVVELCQAKGRKHLMPLLLEAVQTWNEFKDAVQLGLDKPEVCNNFNYLLNFYRKYFLNSY